MESKLKEDYDGYEDFLEYAIKQFRHLETEEKRVRFWRFPCFCKFFGNGNFVLNHGEEGLFVSNNFLI